MFGITATLSLPVLGYIALTAKPGQSYLVDIVIFLVVVGINAFAIYYDHIVDVRERQRRYFDDDEED